MTRIIPPRLTMVLILAIVFYFIIILSLLKHRMLNMKYTLLWLLTGVVMLILVIKPMIVVQFKGLVGITDNMNLLFIVFIGFLIMLVLSLTSIASRQQQRITRLIQAQGLLEKRVRELEESVISGDNEVSGNAHSDNTVDNK
ncbi:DUF2304 domain-containing protein [Butyrivibrio fibrisolvens]|uniref:DUF2304 domain-containing protein n=1 Tax=Butyrivibrio fibrisolvens TaxID=831 RepID=UPI00047F7E8F|nr:DUF2304 domain-containing protein [Butyrivibrio fibrisolvens]